MELKDRISTIIKQKGISKTDFAKSIKVSQGFVSQMCSGVAKPSDRTIELICREYGVDETWLRTGEGSPYRETTRIESIMKFATATAKGSEDFKKSVLYMLSMLDEQDWKNLSDIFDKCKDILQK